MSNESEIFQLRREMMDQFDRINKTLIELIQAVDKLDGSCSKMDDHINFVENTYETLKSPLDYISSRVNRLRGVDERKLLPQLQHSKSELE